MKKILLLITFLCAVLTLPAQNDYDFSVSNISYQDLTGSISLNNGYEWDDPHFAIPLGFNFQIANHTFNTIHIVDWSVGGLLSSSQHYGGVIPIMMPLGQDIIDRGYFTGVSQSNISYKIDGTTGSRIVKIEWNNVGFLDDSTENDFMNFQLWVYEGTNIVEYHYGPSSINNPSGSYEGETGPNVGFFPSYNIDTDKLVEDAYFLTGNPVNPTLLVLEPGDEQSSVDALSGTIPDGTVYTFTPQTLSVNDVAANKFLLYPNPTTEYFQIQHNNEELEVNIYDSNGKNVKHFNYTSGTIDIRELSQGFYFVELISNGGKTTKKLIKK